MQKFIIERTLPGAGQLSAGELRAISQKSCAVVGQLGGRLQWIESFVTTDKIYCVHLASSEQVIREHARLGGFPVDRITPVACVIDPSSAATSA